MNVLDAQLSRVPGLKALSKREAIVGFYVLVAITLRKLPWGIALSHLATNAGVILLVIPLAIDCGIAVSNSQRRQAINDCLACTMVVSTHRGYSLDIKVKRLLAQVRSRVQK